MHFTGSRRARVVITLMLLLLMGGLWHVSRMYVSHLQRSMAPTLLAQLRKALQRDIQVDRLVVDKPGSLVAEGVRVARGPSFKDGTFVTADRLEVTYDPSLLEWGSLITRALGRDTRAKVRVTGIHMPQLPANGDFVFAESAETTVDFGAALRGRPDDVLGTVARVNVHRAMVRLVRTQDGRWNYEQILKLPKSKKPPTFRGEIVLTDSGAELSDYRSGGLPAPVLNRASGEGTLRFAGYPRLQWTVGGQVRGTHGGAFQLHGTQHAVDKRWFVSLDAGASDLRYWYRYVATDRSTLDVVSGRGQARLVAWGVGGKPAQPPVFSLKLDVSSGEARLATLAEPLKAFNGVVTVDPTFITVDGTTQVARFPVRVSGDITRGGTARAELRLSSNALTLSGLRRAFPASTLPQDLIVPNVISAQVVLKAVGKHWTIQGTGSTPVVRYRDAGLQRVVATYRAQADNGALTALSAHLQSATGHVRDVTGESVRADIRSKGKLVDVAARFRSLGGEVDGQGWVEVGDDPNFYVSGRVKGLRLAQIPWKQEQAPRISGAVTGDFVAAGTVASPRVDATLRATSVAFNEEAVDEISARVHWTSELLDIPYATIRDGRGQVALRGAVRDGSLLDLHASAEGVELGSLLRGRAEQRIGGTAYLSADVTGTVESPQVMGRVQVYRPVFGEQTADYLEARVDAASRLGIELVDVKLTRAPAEASSKRLALSRPDDQAPWAVNGELEVRGLTLVQAMRAGGVTQERLREAPVSGDLGPLLLTVSGDVEHLKAQFTASAASVAAAGLDLGEVDARGDVDLGARRVRITEMSSRSPQGAATVSGEVRWSEKPATPERDVETTADLAVAISNIRLAPLLRRFVPDLAQMVRAQGAVGSATATVRGSLSAPQVAGRVELAGLIVNERAVQVDPFEVDWNGSAVLVRNVTAHLGSGRVRLPYLAALLEPGAEKRPWLERLAGSVVVEHVPVGVARQLLEDSPYFRTARADSVRETLSLWRSPVGGDISGAVRIETGAVVPATAADAARLLRAQNTSPSVTATLEIPNLVSPPGSDHPPTQLVGAAAYRNKRLDLKELRLRQEGGAVASITGYFDDSVENRPAELRFSARASTVRLRSLSLLPIADVRERLEQLQPLDGLLELQAEVTGTEKAPMARFTVYVAEPVLYGIPLDHFKLAQGEYDGGKGELRVAEARVTKQLEGAEEAGVLFSGTLPITWPELASPRTAPRKLTVEVPDQSLKVFSTLATDAEAYAAQGGGAPSERVKAIVSGFRQVAATEGRMQGKMTLGGTGAQPRNEGGLALMDATLRIDGLQTVIRKFNARLDLAGDLVRVAEFTGESSKGGSFTGGGVVRLSRDINGKPIPNLDLSLSVRQFRVEEKQVSSLLGESFAGTQFTGTLDTVSIATPEQPRAITIRGDWPTPTVDGGVRLDDSTLLLTYEDKGLPDAPVARPDIRLNLRFFAGESVWLRNPQLRLKIEGSVLASNTTAEPVITGDLPVTRGTLQLAGLRLRNAEGVIRVAYDQRNQDLGVAPPPPIYVDLAATTSLRVARATADEAEYYDTTFEIRGAPGGGGNAGIRQTGVGGGLSVGSDSGLTLTVRTDPPLPSREIEALIRQQFGVEGFSGSGANVVEALRGQIEQAFAINVTSALTGRIEDVLQSALGLSTLSLDLGISQPLRVRLGKRLFGPIYGTVSQEFGSVNSQRQFELYYRINPQLRIGVRQEDPPGRKVFFFSGTATF